MGKILFTTLLMATMLCLVVFQLTACRSVQMTREQSAEDQQEMNETWTNRANWLEKPYYWWQNNNQNPW